MSVFVFVCMSICLCVPFPCIFRPLIGPQIVARSSRQQPVDRINPAADRGDGNEDEDKDKDEIPSYAGLLTALVEIFCISRM